MVKKLSKTLQKNFIVKNVIIMLTELAILINIYRRKNIMIKMIIKTLHLKTLTIVVVEKNINFNRVTVDIRKHVNLLLRKENHKKTALKRTLI